MISTAPQGGEPEEGGVSAARYLSALRRYKWLVLAFAGLGAAGGVAATRFIKPKYEARATIWISQATPPAGDRSGPIRAEELLAATSWVELLRSFTIVDSVVLKDRLFLKPAKLGDTVVFRDVRVGTRVIPDQYVLNIDQAGRIYTIALAKTGAVVDRGLIGDSVGARIGLRWHPDTAVLRRDTRIAFTLTTPRDASLALLDVIQASLERNSNFLRLTLTGSDPVVTSATLNTWVKEFVATAAELKRRNLTEFSKILSAQLRYAGEQLRTAEVALETFRVNTITLPSESTPITPGIEATKGPVFSNFFSRKIEYDNVRRDRDALERILNGLSTNQTDIGTIASIPGLLQTPGADALSGAFKELYAKEAELRNAERMYTDEHRTVKALRETVRSLRAETLPRLGFQLLAALKDREADLSARLDAESRDMRGIPSRTIEEMRLRREVATAENLYTTLQNRFEEATLAEASSVPDVTILDLASPPNRPRADTKPRVIAMSLAAGLGLGLALALLLDRLDQRFRYPEQVRDDLRLQVLGTVPTLSSGRKPASTDEAARVVEAFREVRLQLQHSTAPGEPLLFTITSTSSGDGKSMVSANLALSFAEAGYRTLLIDGDTRRGTLHDVFAATRRPGFIELLSGAATPEDAFRSTTHPQLTLLPSGGRGHKNPELLAGATLPTFLNQMRDRFDAIVVDSPPLAAGIDAFALSTACGNAVLVLRQRKTDVRLTAMKLEILERLPLRIVGAVLNSVESKGLYKYYFYERTGSDVPDDETPAPIQIGRVTA